MIFLSVSLKARKTKSRKSIVSKAAANTVDRRDKFSRPFREELAEWIGRVVEESFRLHCG